MSDGVAAGADPAGTSSSAITSGAGASAASSPAPARSEASASKPEEEGTPQASGEDKENDAAAVTAVIWKELAELSAVQAKLKVCAHLPHGLWMQWKATACCTTGVSQHSTTALLDEGGVWKAAGRTFVLVLQLQQQQQQHWSACLQ